MNTSENAIAIKHNRWGRYVNPWDSWREKRMKAAYYLLTNKPSDEVWPSPSNSELAINLPLVKPVFGPPFINLDPDCGVRLTWLGHASVLFHLDGVNILCDPIFSSRCVVIGPKRYRPIPCKVEDLPRIHAVVISHNHFDHLDLPTIRQLSHCFPDIIWCIPIGCADLIALTINSGKGRCRPRIWEAVWWEERTVGDSGVRLIFTPAQHWSGRNIFFDNDRSLWGSWTFVGPSHRVWFAGDTGYCEVFRSIGDRYGPIDVAAIPIGAYTPRDLMHSQHVNPEEAVQIHRDIRATHSVGVHWGTFHIGRELYMQPKADLKEALDAVGLTEADFRTLYHGQSLCYRRVPTETLIVE
ncbi:N-acyl-phosphatidylethanolamine-hydrolyzing phospholipase D [Taenia crassiceps]|uniref:N-acetylphosphatidylethanolamine-hydrolyzing phospholipase D n=1 Tax=Taenia crassiceps TaxID=6207 RepID=A0ABR4QHP6_9CEST